MECQAYGGFSRTRLAAAVLSLLLTAGHVAAYSQEVAVTPDPQVKLTIEPIFDGKASSAPSTEEVPRSPGTPAPPHSTTILPTGPIVDGPRATAAALNYCRAAFHRIRQQPNKVTLAQEQEKILNNLNLDGVVDQEVIQLYSSVLDEIGQVGVADQERALSKQLYRSTVARKVTWDMVALGADIATAQVGSAVRTGASSWWDYRTTTTQHETDLMKIEKARMASVAVHAHLLAARAEEKDP